MPLASEEGRGRLQGQWLAVGPCLLRTRQEGTGDEEYRRVELREARGLLIPFLQARQPAGLVQNQRPRRDSNDRPTKLSSCRQ